jgi:hypothetical protein
MKSYLFATVVALALTAVRGQTSMAPGQEGIEERNAEWKQ